MSARIPIEKWNRSELEDRFHAVSGHVQQLKQSNNRLEREVKILNGRVGAISSRGGAGGGAGTADELDELHRTNQLMAQKLKVLKHQLLSYTRLNSTQRLRSSYGSRPSTGANRPPQRPVPKGANGAVDQRHQENSQKRTPTGDEWQPATRPQSANAPMRQPRATPPQRQQRVSSAGQEAQANNNWRQQEEGSGDGNRHNRESFNRFVDAEGGRSGNSHLRRSYSEFASFESETEHRRDSVQQHPQNGFNTDATNERLAVLQSQNRHLAGENEDLRFSLEKSEQRSSTLRVEYERVYKELEAAQRELRSQSDSLSSFREDAQRRTEGSTKNAEIVEKELAILKAECQALKTAHDRVLSRTLEQENSGRVALEELSALRAQLQQSSSESDSERREWEALVQRLRAENAKLREERKARKAQMESPNNNRFAIDEAVQQDEKIQNNHSNHELSNNNNPREHNNVNGAHENGEALLNKLFADVIGIVDSHLGGRKRDGNANIGLPLGDNNSEERWQKLYEEVYVELEKVRRLLLAEHQLCERLKEEKRQLELEVELAERRHREREQEAAKELEERAKRMGILERKMEMVARTGEFRETLLENGKAVDSLPAIEATELTLHINKLAVSEELIRLVQNPAPLLFLSVEFFDFEIQTSELVSGAEGCMDFSSVFELVVSDLFIHYLQTESMLVELYVVRDGLNYELWSQAQIPLRKLLSTQTPTQFRGDLSFHAMNETNAQLASCAYSVKVPFSLLRALNTQRRKMAATALLPLGEDDELDEPHNELVIHIHRCDGLDQLRSANKKLVASSLYVAYEFFHFPVHMTKLVKGNGANNPTFDDQHSWKLPLGSEAVHKYLREKELLLYLIEGGADSVEIQNARKSSALAHLAVPLFPLVRNHKIRGTFPLVDESDNSLSSKASIDVSIYWKFAYTFDGLDDIDLAENAKRFAPSAEKSAKIEVKVVQPKEASKSILQAQPKTKARRRSAENGETTTAPVEKRKQAAQKPEKEKTPSSSEEGEEVEEIGDEELRRRLFILPTRGSAETGEEESASKQHIPIEEAGQQEERIGAAAVGKNGPIEAPQMDEKEEVRAESEQSRISEPSRIGSVSPKSSVSSGGVPISQQLNGEKLREAEERSPSSEMEEESLKKEGSETEEERQPDEQEEREDDAASLRSDATYTAEGPLGPIPFEEHEEEEVQKETVTVEVHAEVETEQLQQIEEERRPPPVAPPIAPARRSLLGDLPPIIGQTPAPMPRVEVEKGREVVTMRRNVEFTEPLHSSIPPSDISSSFDNTLGSDRSTQSNSSGASNGSKGTETNGGSAAEGETTKRKEKKKRMSRPKKPKREILLAPAPPTPAIRVRSVPQHESVESSETENGGSPRHSVVELQVRRLRILDHSPLLHPRYDAARVFVEWNFLDFERDQCETEAAVQMPREAIEAVNFNFQKAYELDRKRIALLRQWTELNIRMTFTLVSDPGDGEGDLDDLCMGELDLYDVLDSSTQSLIMRNVDNLAVAVLEVGVEYSERLLTRIRDAMVLDEGEEENAEDEADV